MFRIRESGPGGNWTRDLYIASPTPYRSATTQHILAHITYRRGERGREFICQENNNTVIICYNNYNGMQAARGGVCLSKLAAIDIQLNNNCRYWQHSTYLLNNSTNSTCRMSAETLPTMPCFSFTLHHKNVRRLRVCVAFLRKVTATA